MAAKGIWIPIEVLQDHSLTMQEKFIMMEIYQLLEMDSGQCYASNEHFSKLLDVGKKSVSNTISSLVKKGKITVELSDRNHKRLLSTKDGQSSTKDGQSSTKDGQSKENKTINKTINRHPSDPKEIIAVYKETNIEIAEAYINSRESTGWKRGRTQILDWVPDYRQFEKIYLQNNKDPKQQKDQREDRGWTI